MQHPDPADLGWFTPPDLEILFSALSKLPDPRAVVLVGGQSLSFWVDFYNIPVPSLDTLYLTQDADFLGTHRDATLLARELGAEIRLATMDDHTPNLATLLFKGVEGQRLLIDILSVVIGLSEAEIKSRAIPIVRGDQQLHILHPLLCLKSRIENLRALSSKRNGNGISQAEVAVKVARAYIRTLLNAPTNRDAINAVKQIKSMALSPAGVFVFKKYSIDLLDAVEPDRFKTSLFRDRDWPNIQRWVAEKRKHSPGMALGLPQLPQT